MEPRRPSVSIPSITEREPSSSEIDSPSQVGPESSVNAVSSNNSSKPVPSNIAQVKFTNAPLSKFSDIEKILVDGLLTLMVQFSSDHDKAQKEVDAFRAELTSGNRVSNYDAFGGVIAKAKSRKIQWIELDSDERNRLLQLDAASLEDFFKIKEVEKIIARNVSNPQYRQALNSILVPVLSIIEYKNMPGDMRIYGENAADQTQTDRLSMEREKMLLGSDAIFGQMKGPLKMWIDNLNKLKTKTTRGANIIKASQTINEEAAKIAKEYEVIKNEYESNKQQASQAAKSDASQQNFAQQLAEKTATAEALLSGTSAGNLSDYLHSDVNVETASTIKLAADFEAQQKNAPLVDFDTTKALLNELLNLSQAFLKNKNADPEQLSAYGALVINSPDKKKFYNEFGGMMADVATNPSLPVSAENQQRLSAQSLNSRSNMIEDFFAIQAIRDHINKYVKADYQQQFNALLNTLTDNVKVNALTQNGLTAAVANQNFARNNVKPASAMEVALSIKAELKNQMDALVSAKTTQTGTLAFLGVDKKTTKANTIQSVRDNLLTKLESTTNNIVVRPQNIASLQQKIAIARLKDSQAAQLAQMDAAIQAIQEKVNASSANQTPAISASHKDDLAGQHESPLPPVVESVADIKEEITVDELPSELISDQDEPVVVPNFYSDFDSDLLYNPEPEPELAAQTFDTDLLYNPDAEPELPLPNFHGEEAVQPQALSAEPSGPAPAPLPDDFVGPRSPFIAAAVEQKPVQSNPNLAAEQGLVLAKMQIDSMLKSVDGAKSNSSKALQSTLSSLSEKFMTIQHSDGADKFSVEKNMLLVTRALYKAVLENISQLEKQLGIKPAVDPGKDMNVLHLMDNANPTALETGQLDDHIKARVTAVEKGYEKQKGSISRLFKSDFDVHSLLAVKTFANEGNKRALATLIQGPKDKPIQHPMKEFDFDVTARKMSNQSRG